MFGVRLTDLRGRSRGLYRPHPIRALDERSDRRIKGAANVVEGRLPVLGSDRGGVDARD